MIDFTEIPWDTDGWEQFSRDFLTARGFYIESTIDRGADQGKDMLVTERFSGSLGSYQLRWLVSCKHFAKSKKSVSEGDEQNILERIEHFKADGFIGLYSTLASSGLNTRLKALRDNNKIKDYSIFDGRLIENYLVTVGYSTLMMRYFPKSYEQVKPLHFVDDKYQPLCCKVCGKDLLMELFTSVQCGILVYSCVLNLNGSSHYEDIYVVCKGKCDKIAEKQQHRHSRSTEWDDLDDKVVPIEFLRTLFSSMDQLREGSTTYSDQAFKKKKEIMLALAQRVLRSTTEEERKYFLQLANMRF